MQDEDFLNLLYTVIVTVGVFNSILIFFVLYTFVKLVLAIINHHKVGKRIEREAMMKANFYASRKTLNALKPMQAINIIDQE